MKLFLITFLVFVINIPFGYWRSNVRKFSLQWVLAIHIPVPFVIALRIFSKLGFQLYTYFFLLGAFFLGQKFGNVIYKWLKQKKIDQSSNIFKDLLITFSN